MIVFVSNIKETVEFKIKSLISECGKEKSSERLFDRK